MTIADITNPNFWSNQEGKHPQAFETITAEDVRSGVYQPTDNSGDMKKKVDDYFADMRRKETKFRGVLMVPKADEVFETPRTITSHHFTYVQGSGWEALYHNGVLCVEAEKLTPFHVLHSIAFVVDQTAPGTVTYETRKTHEIGRFPRDYAKLITDLQDAGASPIVHMRPGGPAIPTTNVEVAVEQERQRVEKLVVVESMNLLGKTRYYVKIADYFLDISAVDQKRCGRIAARLRRLLRGEWK